MTHASPILLRFLAALATVTLLFAPIARAQQNAVTVRVVVPPKVYLGDTTDLSIAITGSRDVEPPDLSALKDFDITYRGPQDSSSTMTTIINGRVSTSVNINYAHIYALSPKRIGAFEVPPITLTISGRSYTTAAIPIEVVEPTLAPDFKLAITTDLSEAFVNQPITLKLIWTLGKDVREGAFSLPITGPEYETMPGPLTRALTGHERSGVVQIKLNGQPVLALYHNNVVTVDRVIVPSKSGTLSIGPARADFQAVIGQRELRPLDSFFEDRAITDRQFSAAPLIVIPVSDLPAAGKPANFSGLVGIYTINASADASSVSVGDPINLSVGVSGPFPLSLIPALDLSRQSSLSKQFRVPREPALPQLAASNVGFSAMIRARDAATNEIGPISLNFFDPESKSYKTVSSKPIPLTVRASAAVTLPDIPEDAAPLSPPPAKRPGGLPDIDRAAPLLSGDAFDLQTTLTSPTTIALLVLPPLCCLLALAIISIFRWRHRDPAALRRRAALARLKRDLRRARCTPNSLDSIAHALSNFAADAYDQPRDTVTGTRAATLLSQSGTPSGTELAALLHACDESRFGIGGSTPPDRETLSRQALSAARSFAAQFRNAQAEGITT